MSRKKNISALIIVTILLLSVLQISAVSAATDTVESPADTNDVVDFITDVLQLDMTQYNATVTTLGVRYRDWLGGLAQTNGRCTLDSTGSGGTSLLDVTFQFVDKTLVSCNLYIKQGSVLYSQKQPTDSIEAAKGFLERYQAFYSNQDLSEMTSILSTVSLGENTTKTSENLSLEVTVQTSSTQYVWSNMANGVAFSNLVLKFENGEFKMFSDDRSYSSIGSTEVNIVEDDAIQIALSAVKDYSYIYDNKEVSDFVVVEKYISAEMQVQNRSSSKPLEMFPFWLINLPLDTIYPGRIYYFEVKVWADTGEVFSCLPLGYGDDVRFTQPPSASPTTIYTNSEKSPMFGLEFPYVLLIAIPIIVLLAIAVIYRKRQVCHR
jgi:hypothetical protein